jgi:hypothetical protein
MEHAEQCFQRRLNLYYHAIVAFNSELIVCCSYMK